MKSFKTQHLTSQLPSRAMSLADFCDMSHRDKNVAIIYDTNWTHILSYCWSGDLIGYLLFMTRRTVSLYDVVNTTDPLLVFSGNNSSSMKIAATSIKDTAAKVGGPAKSGMEKTKATLQKGFYQGDNGKHRCLSKVHNGKDQIHPPRKGVKLIHEVGKLGNVTSDQVVKEKQSSLVDTTTPNTENTGLNSYPPLPTQGSTSAGNSPDVVVLVESIRAISDRLANTAYGFFLGKRLAYPIVANYLALWMVLDPTLDRSLLPVKDGE
ncbi:U5 small nuclear ribonucleoprotein helicase [Tanacetum coccineum]